MNGLQSTARLPELVALAARESLGSPASLQVPRVKGDLAGKDAGAPSLRELSKAICRGDEAAFTRFYDLYSLRLYKHLLVIAKGNEQEARDVLQTVVVKLARRFKVFDEERRMWGWLSRLARNSYIDLCRARQRERRLVPLEEHPGELADPPNGEHRLSASLHHALEQLTVEERELMRSAYVDERPLQELADARGQTYKAVESRLGRLRLKLKTNLLNHLRHEESA